MSQISADLFTQSVNDKLSVNWASFGEKALQSAAKKSGKAFSSASAQALRSSRIPQAAQVVSKAQLSGGRWVGNAQRAAATPGTSLFKRAPQELRESMNRAMNARELSEATHKLNTSRNFLYGAVL